MDLNNQNDIIDAKIKEINLLILTMLFKNVCLKYGLEKYENNNCVDYIFLKKEQLFYEPIFYFENQNQKIIFKYNNYKNKKSKIIINKKIFYYNNNFDDAFINNADEIKLLQKFYRVNWHFSANQQEYIKYLNKKNIDDKLINQYVNLLKQKEKYECEIINYVFNNFYEEKNKLFLNKSLVCINVKHNTLKNDKETYDYHFTLLDTITNDKLNINFYCFSNLCEGYDVFLNEKEYDELKITTTFKNYLLYNLYTKQEIIKKYKNTKQL